MIRIIKGSYGLRVGKTIKPVNAGDAPIEVSKEEEERLVRLGVAVKVSDCADNESENEKKSGKTNGKSAGKKGKTKSDDDDAGDLPDDDAGDLPDLDAGDAVVDG